MLFGRYLNHPGAPDADLLEKGFGRRIIAPGRKHEDLPREARDIGTKHRVKTRNGTGMSGEHRVNGLGLDGGDVAKERVGGDPPGELPDHGNRHVDRHRNDHGACAGENFVRAVPVAALEDPHGPA